MVDLVQESNRNRISSDRLYMVSYNLLFDLNRYLVRQIGIQTIRLGQCGGDPQYLIENLDLKSWLINVGSFLDKKGLLSNISIRELRIFPHARGDLRDVVQLSQLGLPDEYRYYEGAISIDAILCVELRDIENGVSLRTDFRIRSLCPIRFFLLHDLSNSFVTSLRESICGWIDGKNAKDLAESIAEGLNLHARRFLNTIGKSLFRGRIEYSIRARRLVKSTFEVSVTLRLVETSDMGKFSSVILDGRLHRVFYRLRDIKMAFRCDLGTFSGGEDTAECEGVVCS